MVSKAEDVECPTCGAGPGTPCLMESGRVLLDAHLPRKALASVMIAKAKKQAEQPKHE